jgi:chaperone required for assembly of F1-ATPase
MRDSFTSNFQDRPMDPMEAARRATRPPRAHRFYESVTVGADDEGFAILLDGRRAKTPAQQGLVAPARALAEAVAAEWEKQREVIDPSLMPLTRLSNSIIDGVAKAPARVTAQVAAYLDSDMLCYRADTPRGLVARQAAHWDPIIVWADEVLGAPFIVSPGVIFVAQPQETLRQARAAIPEDPWRLGAVHAITTLTGSALLALAVLRRRLDVDQAWRAAHVDEDWNMEVWGRDQMALERRALRFAEMQAAVTLLERMA